MGKAIKCELILHGSSKEINMGTFKSISKARKYVSECWNRPYTIKPIKS
jgi:hypothetical protein